MSRLTHDINQYGVMIQPKANTTLKAMTKAELIEYIRTLEHNYNVAVDFNERQARNVEAELKKWQYYKDLEEQGRLIEVIRCKDCIRHDNSSVPEGSGWCDEHERMTGDDEYCSYAVDLLAELKGNNNEMG